jgi:hypothetical protein
MKQARKRAIKASITDDEVVECIDAQLTELGGQGAIVVPVGCSTKQFNRVCRENFPEIEFEGVR